jgi:microcystin degradation protein MlrC
VRIAVAMYGQETSSFSPVPTTLDTFRLYGLFEGDDILTHCRDVGAMGGFLETMDAALGSSWTPVPLVHGWAGASGALTADTLAWFEERLRHHLAGAPEFDAFYFGLHGAAVADGEPDTEGYLLRVVRDIVGNDVPLVASLDHHANLTQAMVDHLDAFVAHRTQPHDQPDTGRLAARLLLGMLQDGARPTVAWRKIPLLTHQEQFLTAAGPMKAWFDLAREMETRPGVLSTSTLPMQPWLDVPEGGWAAAVVTDDDADLAERLADELAHHAWDHRDDFSKLDSIPIPEAIQRADEAQRGLVVLTDTGDNIWGGGAGDSTHILAEMIRRPVQHMALLPMMDPETVQAAVDAGVGATITRAVGGKLDPACGPPLQVTARVAAIGGGVLRVPLLGFESFDMGRAALLEIGHVRLVVTEKRGVSGNHPAVYEHFGIDVSQARMVVVKTASNWQFYDDFMDQVIRVDTPGATTSHLEDLPWQHIPRPIYPMDGQVRWP